MKGFKITKPITPPTEYSVTFSEEELLAILLVHMGRAGHDVPENAKEFRIDIHAADRYRGNGSVFISFKTYP